MMCLIICGEIVIREIHRCSKMYIERMRSNYKKVLIFPYTLAPSFFECTSAYKLAHSSKQANSDSANSIRTLLMFFTLFSTSFWSVSLKFVCVLLHYSFFFYSSDLKLIKYKLKIYSRFFLLIFIDFLLIKLIAKF